MEKRLIEDAPDIISLKQAAAILKVSYPTAHRLAQSGELRAFRVRSVWRTSTVACEEFVRRKFEEQEMMCRSVEMTR